ncbi:M20/M25/M40 family metallo-hydrolase [bacterium]|nr:MAG: M20/M25/M40 family metallo-hydrolase [bacterium]
MLKSLFLPTPLFVVLLPGLALAQSPETPSAPAVIYQAPVEVIDKIKDEGLNKSQLMTSLTYLTEVFGPRLTGSPNIKAANDWTKDVMAGRGMQARLETWGPFGRGWTLKKFSAQMDKPYVLPLVAYPKAWTPSTPGEITAEVVYFNPQTEADYGRFKGKLRGKIVLLGQERKLKSIFEPMGTRASDEKLAEMAKATVPTPQPPRPPAPTPPAGAPAAPGTSASGPQTPPRRPGGLPNRLNFLKDEGVALIIDNSSAGSTGNIFVANASVPPTPSTAPADPNRRPTSLPAYDKRAEPRMIPQMTVASEYWNRLYRLSTMGIKPVLSVNIKSQFHDRDLMAYNTVADLPGTDLKDEVVMMGAHMDSWHGGTGATDNGCNVAVVMEAARIIQSLGIQPRRTIRVALWTGEENGLFGSTNYVKAHFGEMTPGKPGEKATLAAKPEYEKLSAYYNVDNGSGKIRGIYAQGNTAAAPYFSEWLKPFASLGAGTMTLQNTGSTDHIPFDRIGLPGFQFIQDDLDYWTQTHHSTMDVLERVQEDDVKFNATILAAFVWQTAMMDEKLPRKALN